LHHSKLSKKILISHLLLNIFDILVNTIPIIKPTNINKIEKRKTGISNLFSKGKMPMEMYSLFEIENKTTKTNINSINNFLIKRIIIIK